MLSGFKRFAQFAKSERGNVAIMMAGLTLPLLAIIGGAIDFSEFNKTRKNIQDAADNAVIAAFHKPEEHWSKRNSRVNQLFVANLARKHRLKFAQSNLRYELNGEKTVMIFSVKAGLDSLFGELSPFSAEAFTVTATAEYDPKSRRRPHLIENAKQIKHKVESVKGHENRTTVLHSSKIRSHRTKSRKRTRRDRSTSQERELIYQDLLRSAAK